VGGETAAGIKSLDCCDLGPTVGVRRGKRVSGHLNPGQKNIGAFYRELFSIEFSPSV